MVAFSRPTLKRYFGKIGKHRPGFGCLVRFRLAFTLVVSMFGSVCAYCADHEQIEFDIEPQNLATALIKFSGQSNFVFVAPTRLTEGKTSAFVKGLMAPIDALVILLNGSGLIGEINLQGVLIVKSDSQGTQQKGNDTLKNKRHSKSILTAILGFLTLGGMQSDPVAAQDASASEPALEEVIVTARKRSENLQDTPISITAFTANMLQDRQIEVGEQLTQVTPNLLFSAYAPSAGHNASSQIFIRGIGQTDFLPSADPGVGLYIDGVYIAHSVGANLDLLDLERVEILRGPQGTLFGRNTIGGAVVLHTKRPSDERSFYAKVKVGSDNRLELNAHLDAPISDTLRTKFSLSKRDRNGYVEQLQTGLDVGDDDTFGARAALEWDAADNFRVYFSADYTKEDENGSPAVFNSISGTGLFARFASFLAGCSLQTGPGPTAVGEGNDPNCANNQWQAGPYANNGTFPTNSELEGWGTNLTLDWDLGGVAIKSITAYREVDWQGSRDADNTPFTILHTINTDTQEQFSQELQLTGQSLGGRLNWLAGAYFFTEDAFDDYFVPIIFGTFNTGGRTENDTKALFAQGTYAFNDKFSLTAGLRWTKDTKGFTPYQFAITTYVFPVGAAEINADGLYVHPLTGELFPLNAPGTAAIVPPGTPFFDNDLKLTKTATDVTPMLTLSYNPSDNVMAYASYSEGFKSGGFNGRNVKPVPVLPNFEPEFAETIEFGLKAVLLDNRLRLNGAIFTTDYTDMHIVIRQDFSPTVFNAGDASIKGFELEWDFVPTNALHISGGIGYLDAKYDSLTVAAIANGVQVENDLPMVRDWSMNMGVSYEITLANGSITPRLDWSYQDDVFFNAINTQAIAQDGYHVLNAAIKWASGAGGWEAVLGVTNLTDELYRLAGNSSLEASASYAESYYARGREWFFSIQRQF